MENGSNNRMEPIWGNRKKQRVHQFVETMFPDNEPVSKIMEVLQKEFSFTPDMLWRVAFKIIDDNKKNSDENND